MTKKIYDIFPPKEKIQLTENKKSKYPIQSKKIIILVGVIFLTIIVSSYYFFLRVDINIWPKTQIVEYEGTIEVRSDVLDYDIEKKIIPGEVFTVQNEISQSFSASGKEKEEKRAQGFLKVYNTFSARSQTLVVGTRFISADGKLFRTTERITIPGSSQEGRRNIPGEVRVKVIAAEPGPEFNIQEKTKFSVPGLFGTAMYTHIFGENLEPITGGFIGEYLRVTNEDVILARETLLTTAKERAKQEIKTTDNFVFNIENMKIEIIKESVEPAIGERGDSFEHTLQFEIKTLAYRRSEMEKFLKEILWSQLAEKTAVDSIFTKMKIWPESLKYESKANLNNIKDGQISLNILATGLFYPDIQEVLIKRELVGLPINQVQITLTDYEEIEKVEIIPRPSWLKNMPASNRIRINTILNNIDLN